MCAQLENAIALAARRLAVVGINFRGALYVRVKNAPLSKGAPRALDTL